MTINLYFACIIGTHGTLIAIAVASSTATVIIAFLLIVIGFFCSYCHRKYKIKKRKKPKPRRPTPPPKELYYNLRPSFELGNGKELTGQMQPKRPMVMYDDIIPPSIQDSEKIDGDILAKSNCPIVKYDNVLSPSEHDLKEQSMIKPKVTYDEVLPPCEQDPVHLKTNMAYRPADSK